MTLMADRDQILSRLILALPGEDLADRAHSLLMQQEESWPQLREGYAGLRAIEARAFAFDGVTIRVEFNPGRLASTSANTDSIRDRPCFLCPANLPTGQRGILAPGGLIVLCNPFPIFREHFTIAHAAHTQQRIAGHFGTMLDLAREMQARYHVLYNGPHCGASAPDHLHFQGGEKGFSPIENEVDGAIGLGETVAERGGASMIAVDDGLRRYVVIEGDARDDLISAFDMLQGLLGGEGGDEPMMNIVASYEKRRWRVLVFPRAKHRPSFFFAEGDAKILISPGVIDCCGVCVTPRRSDFDRLTGDHIREMFREVMPSPQEFAGTISRLRGRAV